MRLIRFTSWNDIASEVVVNAEAIRWFAAAPEQPNATYIHFDDDHLKVQASLADVVATIEAEYGHALNCLFESDG